MAEIIPVLNARLCGETIVEMHGGALDGTLVIVLAFDGTLHPGRNITPMAFTHADAVALRTRLAFLISQLEKLTADLAAEQTAGGGG